MEGGVDRGLAAFTTFADALVEGGGHRDDAVSTSQGAVRGEDADCRDRSREGRREHRPSAQRRRDDDHHDAASRPSTRSTPRSPRCASSRRAACGRTTSARPRSTWGLTDAQYRAKADLWPLNPDGELLLWVIVESKPGLANVRQIAATKGISVMFTGAGTLGGVFSTVGPDGRRVRDDAAWEAANQQILSACKEAKLPCGYPANQNDIESRMKEGFSAFIIQSFSDAGFKAVELGRAAGGGTRSRAGLSSVRTGTNWYVRDDRSQEPAFRSAFLARARTKKVDERQLVPGTCRTGRTSLYDSYRLMNVPFRRSANACRSSSRVFITIGPYQATGSSSGLPETSRKRMPWSPACTVTSSPRSKSTSDRLPVVSTHELFVDARRSCPSARLAAPTRRGRCPRRRRRTRTRDASSRPAACAGLPGGTEMSR